MDSDLLAADVCAEIDDLEGEPLEQALAKLDEFSVAAHDQDVSDDDLRVAACQVAAAFARFAAAVDDGGRRAVLAPAPKAGMPAQQLVLGALRATHKPSSVEALRLRTGLAVLEALDALYELESRGLATPTHWRQGPEPAPVLPLRATFHRTMVPRIGP